MKNYFATLKIERENLLDLLTQYHIPVDTWGRGESKTIDHLVSEINDGEVVLIEDNESKQLIREFSFLAIVVTCHVDGRTYQLTEEKQVFSDGRERVRGSDISVGEKIKQGENNIADATKRALREELGIEDGLSVTENKHVKEVVDSKSYPGLTSCRNRFNVSVRLDCAQYKPDGYMEVQPDKTTYFVWKMI